MTGFDTAEELRRRLADRSAVWEFLRLFTAAWGLPGEPVAAPDEVADRRGFGLPVALREEYACNGLLDPRGMEAEDGPLAFTAGQLVRTHGDDWMWAWVRAQTPADLERIFAALPGARWSQ
ncbi:hypothetical protein ACFQO7_16890 [Catellatospora aurea]|uniref:SUKH-3 immunity protein of toxin-antitoxin system n=1 Tax=Catellatospora aurea TaxID=1337874 RepID=A0ABW2GX04_9ACTN